MTFKNRLAGASNNASLSTTRHLFKFGCKVVIITHFIMYLFQNLISRTSDYLFKATNGKTYFRQVSILLPSNWATSNCTGSDQEVSTATYQSSGSSDIVLTGDHPVYIDKPWTLQFGPCGIPGKKISIPVSFLSSLNDQETKGKLDLSFICGV
jgi:hypothetical protein